MVNLHPESFYSFRKQTEFVRPFAQAVGLAPDGALLAEIEKDLSDAATAHYQRRYRDTISYFEEARAVIYSYLNSLNSP
jgi:hypothetical protein